MIKGVVVARGAHRHRLPRPRPANRPHPDAHHRYLPRLYRAMVARDSDGFCRACGLGRWLNLSGFAQGTRSDFLHSEDVARWQQPLYDDCLKRPEMPLSIAAHRLANIGGAGLVEIRAGSTPGQSNGCPPIAPLANWLSAIQGGRDAQAIQARCRRMGNLEVPAERWIHRRARETQTRRGAAQRASARCAATRLNDRGQRLREANLSRPARRPLVREPGRPFGLKVADAAGGTGGPEQRVREQDQDGMDAEVLFAAMVAGPVLLAQHRA